MNYELFYRRDDYKQKNSPALQSNTELFNQYTNRQIHNYLSFAAM